MGIEDLEVGSKEWEAEVNRLQDDEDASRASPTVDDGAKVEPEAGKAPEDAALQAEAKPEPEAGKSEPEKPADASRPDGVASKDGKHVLPYAALQGARKDAKVAHVARAAAEARVVELEQSLADLKAGKASEDGDLTDEDLAAIAADFPGVAKVAKAAKDLRAEVDALKRAAPEKEIELDADDPVQDAIDAVPMLAEWQATSPTMFGRAVEHDKVLKTSPKWKDKPLEERFAHAAKQVAAEFDIETQDQKPQQEQNGQSKAKSSPEDRINAAERIAPNTLSDFKGGAADGGGGIDRLAPQQQLDRLNNMSKAEHDAYMAKL